MDDSLSEDKFQDKALPFIVFNPKAQAFEISEEAKQMFKNLEGQFGVVSVAGMYRTGKSYLLNKVLLDRKKDEDGFGVGPSVNPCTKGLWIWGRPLRGFDKQGKPINVIIVDSEGIGALDEDSNHDARIFSLCILLSSYFLYNSMNSIDESAISNLNLVLQLTRNIHLKSASNNEDIDPDQYSKYFPSFMWIVRDFSLRMVDSNEEEIDSKTYLETALEESKGFSEQIEEKNRIRRLIKSFFTERSCYIMIRPVIDEELLQNLEKLDESQFRPDFLDQVIKLRNRVTHNVKPKTLNGEILSPEMYLTLAQNYVDAINGGAVPNIENAWHYICQNENKKSLQNAIGMFDDIFVNKVLHEAPLEETTIRNWYRQAKDDCHKHFMKNCVGEVNENYFEDFKKQVYFKYDRVLSNNENESKKACGETLDFEYQKIYQSINNGEIRDLQDYEIKINEFRQEYDQNAPDGPCRMECLNEFLYVKAIEIAYMFINSLSHELEQNSRINEENRASLERHIKDLKSQLTAEKEENDGKFSKMSIEKVEHLAKISALEESVNELEDRLTKLAEEGKNKLKLERQNIENKAEHYKLREEELTKEYESIREKYMRSTKEHEKQIELNNQKIAHLSHNLEEYKSKEANLMNDHEKEKDDIIKTYRKTEFSLQEQLDNLANENEIKEEKISELEQRLNEQKRSYEFIIADYEQKYTGKPGDICSSEEYRDLKEQLENFEAEKQREIESIKEQYVEENQLLNEEATEYKQKFENLQRELDSKIKQFENAKEILEHKASMSSTMIESMNEKLKQEKTNHESFTKMFEDKILEADKRKDEIAKQYMEYRQKSENEYNQLESESQTIQEELQDKLEDLSDTHTRLEEKYNYSCKEYEGRIQELNEQLSKAESDISNGSQNSILQVVEETENKWRKVVKKVESEKDALKAHHDTETEKLQKDTQEQLQLLKSTYEADKKSSEQRYENKIQKLGQRNAELQEEIENMNQNHQDEINMSEDRLNEEVENQRIHFEERINDIMLESQTLNDKIQKLTHEKELLENSVTESNDSIRKEKNALQSQYDQLQMKVNEKDWNLKQVQDKNKRLESKLSQYEQDAGEEQQILIKKNNDLEQEIKVLTSNISELSSKKNEIEANASKKIDMLKQENEFIQKNLIEEKENSRKLKEQYDEKSIKEEKKNEEYFKGKLENSEKQKNAMREKLENKKKELQEMQKQYNDEVPDLKRRNQNLESQIQDLTLKLENSQSNYELELKTLKDRSNNQSSGISKENEILKSQLENYKREKAETENQLIEVKNDFEKETMLLKQKMEFLERQKNEAKKEHAENTERFQNILNQISKTKSVEKGRYEDNQQILIDTIESKYKSQIKDENEKHKKEVNELKKEKKRLETDLRVTKDSLQQEQAKFNKLQSTNSREERLQKDLENLKREYENKLVKDTEKHNEEIAASKEKLDAQEKRNSDLVFQLSSKDILAEQNLKSVTSELEKTQSDLQDKETELDQFKTKYKQIKQDYERLKTKASKRGTYGPERSNSNFSKGGIKSSYGSYAKHSIKPQGSSNSSVSGSQKENDNGQRTSIIGSKFIGDKLGKTTNFNQIIGTNKSTIPLQKHNFNSDLINYDEAKEDE